MRPPDCTPEIETHKICKTCRHAETWSALRAAVLCCRLNDPPGNPIFETFSSDGIQWMLNRIVDRHSSCPAWEPKPVEEKHDEKREAREFVVKEDHCCPFRRDEGWGYACENPFRDSDLPDCTWEDCELLRGPVLLRRVE